MYDVVYQFDLVKTIVFVNNSAVRKKGCFEKRIVLMFLKKGYF